MIRIFCALPLYLKQLQLVYCFLEFFVFIITLFFQFIYLSKAINQLYSKINVIINYFISQKTKQLNSLASHDTFDYQQNTANKNITSLYQLNLTNHA